jgi:hypothetical protein
VSIKLETANPVRSFKARGAEVVASLLAHNGSRAVVGASAGNLGQALAWSGRGRGLDATVVASRLHEEGNHSTKCPLASDLAQSVAAGPRCARFSETQTTGSVSSNLS